MKFFEASSKENLHIYPIFLRIASELYVKNQLQMRYHDQVNNVCIFIETKILKLFYIKCITILLNNIIYFLLYFSSVLLLPMKIEVIKVIQNVGVHD